MGRPRAQGAVTAVSCPSGCLLVLPLPVVARGSEMRDMYSCLYMRRVYS